DLGIVQFARVGVGRFAIVCYLVDAWFASIPAPGQSQVPGSTVRPEERAEGAKLEPPHVQLTCIFPGRDKAANVRAPVCNATQPRVDRDSYMRSQRLPGGIHIARPQEGGIALHTGMPVAMQRIWPFIGAIDLRTFPVHSVPG